MIRQRKHDYETVTRPRSADASRAVVRKAGPGLVTPATEHVPVPSLALEHEEIFLKRGHLLSFGALFLFTAVLYARPAEFYPSAFTNKLALILGLVTFGLYLLTQFTLEGTLTARPREVHLALLFMVAALLSIPLAIDPSIAWGEFSATFIRGVLIFIVITNVTRTKARLKAILFLSVVTALVLSAIAVNDYRLGLLTIEGYRAAGHGTGIFGNTNDMALHLVTMLPISVALFFGSRNPLMKVVHAGCALVMMSAILLSYSRGAFLGMLVVLVFFAFRLAPGNRIAIVVLAILGAFTVILLSPSGYGTRLLSIFLPGLDPGGSADQRRGELIRSAWVAVRHPLLGVGMGNYQPLMSLKGLVTHNSYTQVAAEMGATALVLYTTFIVSPLRKLGAIARDSFATRKNSDFYYLALGLQASLLAYMVSSFFLSVAYAWYIYYLVGYAVCFRRIYESETGKLITVDTRKSRRQKAAAAAQTISQGAHPAAA